MEFNHKAPLLFLQLSHRAWRGINCFYYRLVFNSRPSWLNRVIQIRMHPTLVSRHVTFKRCFFGNSDRWYSSKQLFVTQKLGELKRNVTLPPCAVIQTSLRLILRTSGKPSEETKTAPAHWTPAKMNRHRHRGTQALNTPGRCKRLDSGGIDQGRVGADAQRPAAWDEGRG